MMYPRGLLRTTATILVFGLASVTGSQADQKVQETGSAKQSDKATQVQHQHQDQQQKPSKQNRQQRPAARKRQEQSSAKERSPEQSQREQPSTQDRQQRSPAKDRQVRSNRQEPVQKQSQAERPATQRQRSKAAVRSSQRTPVQDRTTSPTRRVAQAPTKQRAAATRIEHQRVWPRYRASNWSSEHRTWTQRGGYRGYRIPSRQFSLYFGRPHRFYLSSYQIRIVSGYPQFYADGFWFTILDPVPEYWGNDWYHTDYVTVVESHGGYYLLSEEYPSAQLAISVHL